MSLSSLADAPFTTPAVYDPCQENRIKAGPREAKRFGYPKG